MPSLRQIRYFLTVADVGGFSPAADMLFVAQPALSRQIAQLEAELGFLLFERGPRGVSLTPAGALFRDRVAGLDRMLLAAAEESSLLARGESGTLRLLHSSSLPAHSLMPCLRQLVEEAPGVRVDLDRVSSEIQVSEVAAGRADLGMVRLPLLRRDPAVTLVDLFSEPLRVLLPAGHPLAARDSLALAELASEPFVSAVHRERGGLARLVADLCQQRGFVPVPAKVISRKTSMLDLVAAGFGLAVVPESLARLAGPEAVCRPLTDDDAVAVAALVLPQRPSRLAQRFVDIARAWVESRN